MSLPGRAWDGGSVTDGLVRALVLVVVAAAGLVGTAASGARASVSAPVTAIATAGSLVRAGRRWDGVLLGPEQP